MKELLLACLAAHRLNAQYLVVYVVEKHGAIWVRFVLMVIGFMNSVIGIMMEKAVSMKK